MTNLEHTSQEQRETPEQFPSQEEIKSAFETILEGREYKELRLRSDEKGVALYEVEVVLENGKRREYNYQRATYDFRDPSLPASARFSASIHMMKYDTGGLPYDLRHLSPPYDGQCVANYLDGTWHYIPQTI